MYTNNKNTIIRTSNKISNIITNNTYIYYVIIQRIIRNTHIYIYIYIYIVFW